MKTLEDRMNLYMDAGFPILYLETFEDDKAICPIPTLQDTRNEW